MLVVGANGHAKEVFQIFQQRNELENLYFFDNVSLNIPDQVFGNYPVIRSFDILPELFEKDKRFVLGLGNPRYRKMLADKLIELGGKLCSIISPFAKIGIYEVRLKEGLNVMTDVVIYNNATVGEGSLLNTACSIHHDCIIGSYCEISPGARILGKVTLGNFCNIGTNAVILPKLKIGNHVTIGAGAVVTKNLPDNSCAVGVPARIKNDEI